MKKVSVADIHEPSGKLEVILFNVGQGDHIMLKFPGGEYGLIDFYHAASMPEPPSLSYFKELHARLTREEFSKVTISFLCISHTDKDHIKGVTATLKKFDELGLFIKDIWLGGAISKFQLDEFLLKQVPELFRRSANRDEQEEAIQTTELFRSHAENFTSQFEKWNRGAFTSTRYLRERGSGEYLVEIRPLPKPSTGCEALNMGPRTTQLQAYFENLSLDLVKRIYSIKHKYKAVDTNLMSHILRLRIGKTNLLFGGDTHRRIWEECLDYFDENELESSFGNYSSQFVKVSHHGSKNSSSPEVWDKILPKDAPNYLAISAGQNHGYGHPHSETLKQIRNSCKNASIFSTNVCRKCIETSGVEIEWHHWYENFISKQPKYRKSELSLNDEVIDTQIYMTTSHEMGQEPKSNEMRLLAYIFEISEDSAEPIRVRAAVSNFGVPYSCFYVNHLEKLRDCCD